MVKQLQATSRLSQRTTLCIGFCAFIFMFFQMPTEATASKNCRKKGIHFQVAYGSIKLPECTLTVSSGAGSNTIYKMRCPGFPTTDMKGTVNKKCNSKKGKWEAKTYDLKSSNHLPLVKWLGLVTKLFRIKNKSLSNKIQKLFGKVQGGLTFLTKIQLGVDHKDGFWLVGSADLEGFIKKYARKVRLKKKKGRYTGGSTMTKRIMASVLNKVIKLLKKLNDSITLQPEIKLVPAISGGAASLTMEFVPFTFCAGPPKIHGLESQLKINKGTAGLTMSVDFTGVSFAGSYKTTLYVKPSKWDPWIMVEAGAELGLGTGNASIAFEGSLTGACDPSSKCGSKCNCNLAQCTKPWKPFGLHDLAGKIGIQKFLSFSGGKLTVGVDLSGPQPIPSVEVEAKDAIVMGTSRNVALSFDAGSKRFAYYFKDKNYSPWQLLNMLGSIKWLDKITQYFPKVNDLEVSVATHAFSIGTTAVPAGLNIKGKIDHPFGITGSLEVSIVPHVLDIMKLTTEEGLRNLIRPADTSIEVKWSIKKLQDKIISVLPEPGKSLAKNTFRVTSYHSKFSSKSGDVSMMAQLSFSVFGKQFDPKLEGKVSIKPDKMIEKVVKIVVEKAKEYGEKAAHETKQFVLRVIGKDEAPRVQCPNPARKSGMCYRKMMIRQKIWIGTAPACNTARRKTCQKLNRSQHEGGKFIGASKKGDGKACTTGVKTLCHIWRPCLVPVPCSLVTMGYYVVGTKDKYVKPGKKLYLRSINLQPGLRIYPSGDTLRIGKTNSRLCIGVNKRRARQPIYVQTCTGSPNQQFLFRYDRKRYGQVMKGKSFKQILRDPKKPYQYVNGRFRLRGTNLCWNTWGAHYEMREIRLYNCGKQPIRQLVNWPKKLEQQFRAFAVPSKSTARLLVSEHSGKCIESKAKSSLLRQYNCNKSLPGQLWNLQKVSNKEYLIRSQLSRKCFDIKGGSTRNGALIQHWTCSKTNYSQRWFLEKVGTSNKVLIRSKRSNKCLRITRGSTQASATLEQRSCNRRDTTQQWQVRVSPSAPRITLRPSTIPAKARAYQICLQLRSGKYIASEKLRTNEIHGNRSRCVAAAIHTLWDLNGGLLLSGDQVAILSAHKGFWTAKPNGDVEANRSTFGAMETFRVYQLAGRYLTSGPIHKQYSIQFKSAYGKWLSFAGSWSRMSARNGRRGTREPLKLAQWKKLTVSGVSKTKASPKVTEPKKLPPPTIPAGAQAYQICLQTRAGKYIASEELDKQEIHANRGGCGDWEKHTLYDLNGGELRSKDRVAILSTHGGFWSATRNGDLEATSSRVGAAETFRMREMSRNGYVVISHTISNNDTIQLKTRYNRWVQATTAGKNRVKANLRHNRPHLANFKIHIVKKFNKPVKHKPSVGRNASGYVGCFLKKRMEYWNDFKLKRVVPGTCEAICKKKRYKYAGLGKGTSCHCSNRFKKRKALPEYKCNSLCKSDRRFKCGDRLTYSVYKVGADTANDAPGYLGCYRERSVRRDLPHRVIDHKGATPLRCVAECKRRGYKYAGLQDGGDCWCNDTFGKYKKSPERECSTPCYKANNLKCGGPFRNRIYKTGYKSQKVDIKKLRGYLGCYKDAGNLRTRDLLVSGQFLRTDPSRCISVCWNKGFRYAGIQNGSQCFCGDIYGKYGKRSEKSCNRSFKGYKCGGAWHNSIYKTGVSNPSKKQAKWYVPRYLGCYPDARKRDLPHRLRVRDLTPALCVLACKKKRFQYAGLQDGGRCFCGHQYGQRGKRLPERRCNKACTKDKKQTCGGRWVNSVYSTGHTLVKQHSGYMGCYWPKRGKAPYPVQWGKVTFASCMAKCTTIGRKYALHKGGSNCYCENNFARLTKGKDKHCDAFCGGGYRCGSSRHLVYSVYKTGLKPGGKKVSGYLGCYKKSRSKAKPYTPGRKMTPATCIKACKKQQFPYASIRDAGLCLCSRSFQKRGKVRENKCSALCPHNLWYPCGGVGYRRVYKTGAKPPTGIRKLYLGCYEAGRTRPMTKYAFAAGKMTLEKCSASCKKKGYKYLGLRLSIFNNYNSRKTACWCGNSYRLRKKKARECSNLCNGVPCGGNRRLSVYKVK